MDTLLNYHSVDLLWGNHDILWMGAAAGSEACIANVIRIALRYGNVEHPGTRLRHQPHPPGIVRHRHLRR